MAKSKIINLLIAAVLACVLWAYVVTVERTDTEWEFHNVPVVMDGENILEEKGLRIISDTDLTVSLRLFGNRSDLNKLRSSDITVLVDLTRIYEAGQKQLPYTVSFPGGIQNSAIEVVSRNPDSISLTVVEWEEKEIPVLLKLTGTTPDNYVTDRQNVSMEHETVTIAGPKDVVDRIAEAQVKVDMSGRVGSVAANFPITLCDSGGKPVDDVSTVTVSVGRVWVEVPVLMVKDIVLDLPVVEGGGLKASDVTVTIGSVDISKENYVITVSGSPADVKKLGDSIQLGIIDLSKESESFQKREYVINLPEGIRNVSGSDTVQVSLTLPMMRSASFKISQEQFEILEPTDYVVECRTTVMTVYIRGRETILGEVTPDNIRVVVDLTEATETGYYPATVTVEGVENVGVVPNPNPTNGKYEVWVIVKPVDSAGG